MIPTETGDYPFQVDSEEDIDVLEIALEGVHFPSDFGVFKAGETISYAAISYVTMTLTEFTEDGERLRSQPFTLSPILDDRSSATEAQELGGSTDGRSPRPEPRPRR